MEMIKRKAYAKINLGLDVLGSMENGYHEVKMVMQSIGIYDELTFSKQESGILLQINNRELPVDGNNLIYKTAKLIMKEYDIHEGVVIKLVKRIPIAAGLAGGSSDAAATIRGMNDLFGLQMSLERMYELGVQIGADVPYCLLGGTALAEGIGEKLTPLPKAPEVTLLVAKPEASVSTREVYEKYDSLEEVYHPDIDGLVKAVSRNDRDSMIECLGNVLEGVTIAEHPVIETIKDKMKDMGAENTLMSGSGPTVYGVFKDQLSAANAFLQLKKAGLAKELFVTTFV